MRDLIYVATIVLIGFVGMVAFAEFRPDDLFPRADFSDVPPDNILIAGNATPGTLYFEMSSFQLDGSQQAGNYLMSVDTRTNELTWARLDVFGMMHRAHSDGSTSAYTFTRSQWRDVWNFAPGIIPFADGGQIERYHQDGSVEIIQHPDGLDFHDFDILPNGDYMYLISQRGELFPDSTLTCLPRCEVLTQSIVQTTPMGVEVNRIDLADYYTRDDYVMDDMLITGNTMLYDVTHANSVELFDNDDLLVSVRHTSQVLRIAQDGSLVWRFGDNGDFTFVNDRGFSHPHTAIPLADDRILLFDNGNGLDRSRAVEYQLNYQDMTATMIWEYEQGFSPNRGSVQRLSNGNTLIAFTEQSPDIVEVTPQGDRVFWIDLPPLYGYATYQAQLKEE